MNKVNSVDYPSELKEFIGILAFVRGSASVFVGYRCKEVYVLS